MHETPSETFPRYSTIVKTVWASVRVCLVWVCVFVCQSQKDLLFASNPKRPNTPYLPEQLHPQSSHLNQTHDPYAWSTIQSDSSMFCIWSRFSFSAHHHQVIWSALMWPLWYITSMFTSLSRAVQSSDTFLSFVIRRGTCSVSKCSTMSPTPEWKNQIDARWVPEEAYLKVSRKCLANDRTEVVYYLRIFQPR